MIRRWSVFTKPWKSKSPEALGALTRSLGFDGIEFPLRPGFPVEPETAETGLPALQKTLSAYGVQVTSVASEPTERVFAACQAAGVPILRIMVGADRTLGYMRSMDEARRRLDAYAPLCQTYGVTLGVQQHYGFGVFTSMELRRLVEPYEPRLIAGIWDAAHSALAGEEPAQGLDILWGHLCLVNLKTAFWRPEARPDAGFTRFLPHFTTAAHGAADWKAAADYLIAHGYEGDICMPAEYTDESHLEEDLAADYAYARSLFPNNI